MSLQDTNQEFEVLPNVIIGGICNALRGATLVTQDFGVIDCLSEVAVVGGYGDVLQASVIVNLSFGPCRMLGLDALIRSKETLGREQDLAAIRQIRAIQERRGRQDL